MVRAHGDPLPETVRLCGGQGGHRWGQGRPQRRGTCPARPGPGAAEGPAFEGRPGDRDHRDEVPPGRAGAAAGGLREDHERGQLADRGVHAAGQQACGHLGCRVEKRGCPSVRVPGARPSRQGADRPVEGPGEELRPFPGEQEGGGPATRHQPAAAGGARHRGGGAAHPGGRALHGQGGVHHREHRALRALIPVLHPLHLPHPPLPGPDGASGPGALPGWWRAAGPGADGRVVQAQLEHGEDGLGRGAGQHPVQAGGIPPGAAGRELCRHHFRDHGLGGVRAVEREPLRRHDPSSGHARGPLPVRGGEIPAGGPAQWQGVPVGR